MQFDSHGFPAVKALSCKLLDCKTDGDDGTGKSIALSHVIHLCAQLNWLIIHVPSGMEKPMSNISGILFHMF